MNWFILRLGVDIRLPDAVVELKGGLLYTNTIGNLSIFPAWSLLVLLADPWWHSSKQRLLFQRNPHFLSEIRIKDLKHAWTPEIMIFSNVTNCLEIVRKILFPVSPLAGLPTTLLVWDNNIAWRQCLHNINELTSLRRYSFLMCPKPLFARTLHKNMHNLHEYAQLIYVYMNET